MKTIKIIDLLNMISKGEEVPKKIKYTGEIYEYRQDDLEYCGTKTGLYLFRNQNNFTLNVSVEIVSEENEEYIEIQKIKNKRFTRNQKQIAVKINELIDAVNEIRKWIEE